MRRLGFMKRGFNRYQNSIIEIADLHEANVLVGADGNFYFIDTVPRLMDKKIYWEFILK
jgi:RIO-like serine/threonine protein kinase